MCYGNQTPYTYVYPLATRHAFKRAKDPSGLTLQYIPNDNQLPSFMVAKKQDAMYHYALEPPFCACMASLLPGIERKSDIDLETNYEST